MQTVDIRIKIEKYLIITTLSTEHCGRIVEKSYSINKISETQNESEIKGLINGLKHLKRQVEIKIHIKAGYLNLSLKSLESWKNNDWKNSKGKEVKYKSLWKEAAELLSLHQLIIELEEK